MTIDTILTALIDWAAARNITIVATKRNFPPAELDMRHDLAVDEAGSAGAGLHVFIDAEVHGGSDDYIGYWIPDSLKKATWIVMENDEGGLGWIPDFADEKSLVGFIDDQTASFLLNNIISPALDEWLADKGISYQVVDKKEFSGEAAEEAFNHDLLNWLFVQFQDSEGYDMTLGISGKGEAATFYADEDGFLNFDQRESKLSTAAKLNEWLASIVSTKN